MKFIYIISFSLATFFCGICQAQSVTVSTDFTPASSNQPGKQYPQVNGEGRVRAGILAPEANKVQLDIGGKKYDLTKDDKGVWTGESMPQDEGFHYYQLNIDGSPVPEWLTWRRDLLGFASLIFNKRIAIINNTNVIK